MPNPYAAERAQGLALQQAGKFAEAEAISGRIVATDGKQAQARHGQASAPPLPRRGQRSY